ncbi:hypothetical protein E4L98_01375 [Duganella callida]|uniref:Uncharacterized protein n=2 Tax=Duganella callida TaxID=2561932 RepID=A0A4Y9SVX7_9BURK|nr:hypothetical protein E4L98_01375 [Duganella callida]
MMPIPIGSSTRRLVASVQKLEATLASAGLPRFVARLPVCWLSWHYCRLLDQKIERIRRIRKKFERWWPAIRDISEGGKARREMLDLDRSMRDDIEYTKSTMLELRDYCVDIGRMFEQLGYESARLKRRQAVFMELLESSCAAASKMQDALTRHDDAVLALLRADAAENAASRAAATAVQA